MTDTTKPPAMKRPTLVERLERFCTETSAARLPAPIEQDIREAATEIERLQARWLHYLPALKASPVLSPAVQKMLSDELEELRG